MAALSNYLQTALLNHSLGVSSFTMPTTVYAGLFTNTLSAAGGGTEVVGNAYSRQAITFSAASVVNSQGQTANSNAVLFGPATLSGWGTLQSFGLFDAASGGNMLYFGAIVPNVTVAVNDSFQFRVGDLVINDN